MQSIAWPDLPDKYSQYIGIAIYFSARITIMSVSSYLHVDQYHRMTDRFFSIYI